ncbi:MAG: hypothetical protein Q8L07_04260 [Sediminibacterium sp.]|nr:hypothetical protein [Sediminibacterium sp.]
MATKKKDYIFLAIMAAAGGWLIYDTFIKPPNPTTTTSFPDTSTAGYPIRYNQYNAAVKQLQAIVGTTQDGIIGPLTLAAIRVWLPNFNQNFVINSYADIVQLGNDFIEARYNG